MTPPPGAPRSSSAPRVPRDVARRFGARVLDRPATSPGGGTRGAQATAYLGQSLLVTGGPSDSRSTRVRRLAETQATRGLDMVVDTRLDAIAEQLAAQGEVAREIVDRYWVSTVHLTPTREHPARSPVDAWPVLENVRFEGLERTEVRLDHPAFACASRSGPAGGSGDGGRRPVSLVMPAPSPRRRAAGRRPVVVVPDTGIGPHPWFEDEAAVCRTVSVHGVRLGIGGPMHVSPPTPRNPLQGSLPRYAGHGTFIAGIIRQQCPQARIEGIRIMDDEGGVHERLLINTLVALLVRQAVAITNDRAADVFDVVSLSLGYYHEEPGDESTDPILAGLLRDLGSWGVAVVASAGNDGTTAPFHPASFAGQAMGLRRDSVPLVSVGAMNPNGSVAHFSNSGTWVSCVRPGVEVVSTLPTNLQGTDQAGETLTHEGSDRGSLDPDDFSGGFGTWSGTSFAAPMFAGQLAQHLARSRSLGAVDRVAAVRRGWAAVRRELPEWKRSRAHLV
ncbi:MAG: S8 family serine peptidase [Ornithinimicrobium sp.]